MNLNNRSNLQCRKHIWCVCKAFIHRVKETIVRVGNMCSSFSNMYLVLRQIHKVWAVLRNRENVLLCVTYRSKHFDCHSIFRVNLCASLYTIGYFKMAHNCE